MKKYKFLSDAEDSDLGIRVKKGDVLYGTEVKNDIVVFHIKNKYASFPIMTTPSLYLLEETDDMTTNSKAALKWAFVGIIAVFIIYKLKNK